MRRINLRPCVAIISIITAVIVASCQVNPQDQSSAKTSGFVSVRFSAYANREASFIESHYYRVSLEAESDIGAALELSRALDLDTSHLLFRTSLGGNGGVELPDGKSQSVDSVEANIRLLFDGIGERLTQSKELYISASQNLPDANLSELIANIDQELQALSEISYRATGFQAVIPAEKLDEIRGAPRILKVEQLVVADQETQTRVVTPSSVTAKTWEPNWHRIVVQSILDDTIRSFYWEGAWTNSANVTAIQSGTRPAFEPDIKLRFITFLGLPTSGWAEPNPLNNGHSWYGSFPNSYLDTQFTDGNERGYCVGTTSPEVIQQNQVYYTYVNSPKWNSTSSTVRQIAYEIQKFTNNLDNCEADTWCVGLPGSTKDEAVIFSLGEHLAPYTSPTY